MKTLVEGFAADPNTQGPLQPFKIGASQLFKTIWVSAFVMAWIQNPAIVQYLLAQDNAPLTRQTLEQSIEQARTYLAPNVSRDKRTLLETFIEATQINLAKLDHIEKAEAALVANEYKTCLQECDRAEEAKIEQLQQHNERLFTVRYQAHYKLKEFKQAQEYLQKLRATLQQKHQQIVDPAIKIKLQEKITKCDKVSGIIQSLGFPPPAPGKSTALIVSASIAPATKVKTGDEKETPTGAGSQQIMSALGAAVSEAELPQAAASDLASAAIAQHTSSPLAHPLLPALDAVARAQAGTEHQSEIRNET